MLETIFRLVALSLPPRDDNKPLATQIASYYILESLTAPNTRSSSTDNKLGLERSEAPPARQQSAFEGSMSGNQPAKIAAMKNFGLRYDSDSPVVRYEVLHIGAEASTQKLRHAPVTKHDDDVNFHNDNDSDCTSSSVPEHLRLPAD